MGDITSADVKALLNHGMNEGYAYTTVKKVYNLLTDYFRCLTQQEVIQKDPMQAAPMLKKANFLASQGGKTTIPPLPFPPCSDSMCLSDKSESREMIDSATDE